MYTIRHQRTFVATNFDARRLEDVPIQCANRSRIITSWWKKKMILYPKNERPFSLKWLRQKKKIKFAEITHMKYMKRLCIPSMWPLWCGICRKKMFWPLFWEYRWHHRNSNWRALKADIKWVLFFGSSCWIIGLEYYWWTPHTASDDHFETPISWPSDLPFWRFELAFLIAWSIGPRLLPLGVSEISHLTQQTTNIGDLVG